MRGKRDRMLGLRRWWWFAAAIVALMTMTHRSWPQGLPQQALQRVTAAHGRALTTGEIRDWSAEGKITTYTSDGRPKKTFDMTLLRKGSSQVQRIIKQGAHELRQGTNGEVTWDSLDGRFTTIAQGSTLHFIESQTIRSVHAMLNYGQTGLAVRDLGPDGKTRQLEAEDRQGRKTRYFMDEESGLITRLEFVALLGTDIRTRAEQTRRDTYEFSDYRSIQGVMTPFRIERFSDGHKIEEIQWTSHKYNAAIQDSAFRP